MQDVKCINIRIAAIRRRRPEPRAIIGRRLFKLRCQVNFVLAPSRELIGLNAKSNVILEWNPREINFWNI